MLPNSRSDSVDEAYKSLRRTAASDPKEARIQLLRILTVDSPQTNRILDLMNSPSDGRLRQLLANTARTIGDKSVKDRLIPHLLRWQLFESDEFTKLAINAALQGIDLAAYADAKSGTENSSRSRAERGLLFSEEHIEIYRWVAGRLCHRVRNCLGLPAANLSYALQCAAKIENVSTRDAITTSLTTALQSFRQIGRIVEFNIDDDHFIWRSVNILGWIRTMNDRYRYKYGEIALDIIDNTKGVSPNVAGMDLLFEIAFWNIWKNSAEEIGAGCAITLVASVDREWVNLLITDNGPGFRDSQALEAFQLSISTRGEERGRGLLEVADAIRRLRGVAQIISVNGEHRINISLPLAPKEIA